MGRLKKPDNRIQADFGQTGRREGTHLGARADAGSQRLGESLEEGFVGLLGRLFDIDDDRRDGTLESLRRQAPGTQYGHDIQFDCVVAGRPAVKCFVECKNYTGRHLRTGDIAEKLLSMEHHWRDVRLDQYIIVSPHAEPSNELDLMIQSWNEQQRFPFEIQVWSPANGVRQLFAVSPMVYEAIYGERPDEDLDSAAVVARWLDRLRPAIRLPRAWVQYLSDQGSHCIGSEDREHFADLWNDHVEPKAADERGDTLPGSLLSAVQQWLGNDEKRSLLLLAEFGEGKSFFSYSLTRRLSREFLADPSTGSIAVRIGLRDLKTNDDPRDFIDRRLREFGSSIGEWNSLTRSYRTMIILDGFDEMSARLDSVTLGENIRRLSECFEYLASSKVLITSRTHFFETRRQQERFLDRVGRPQILRIAPITRARRLEHLMRYAKRFGLEDKLRQLQQLYDPIGLAAKPLFLQMIKATLSALPDDKFDELVLYQTYVDTSLRRKISDLEEESAETLRSELVSGLQEILEEVAVSLHVTDVEWVGLRDVGHRMPLAEKLWRSTGEAAAAPAPRDAADDLSRRVGIRSLLKPVLGADQDSWPVEFFHRSMREYFVARRIVGSVRRRVIDESLRKLPLQPEIANFALLMMRADNKTDYGTVLLSETRRHVVGMDLGVLGGNCLSLLFGLNKKLPRRDWQGLCLDYAYLSGADLTGASFAGSTLRYANLDNTNLTGADVRNVDLTGVRIEETAPITAATAMNNSPGAYCMYGDGVIREWRVAAGGRPMAEKVVSDAPTNARSIHVTPHGDLVVFRPFGITVYGSMRDGWRELSSFRIGRHVRAMDIRGSQVLVAEYWNTSGESTATRYSPGPRTVDQVLACGLPSTGLALCQDLCVVPGQGQSLVAVSAETGDSVELPYQDVSDVDVMRTPEGTYLIAVGRLDGSLSLCRVDRGTHPPEWKEMWRGVVHDGAVTAVRFVANDFVLTGGADRAAYLYPLRADSRLAEPLELQLTIKCAGLKWSGVRGPHEADLIRKLVERADANSEAGANG
ncbi:NACHT domain-containing protein [Actinoplanes aureus]